MATATHTHSALSSNPSSLGQSPCRRRKPRRQREPVYELRAERLTLTDALGRERVTIGTAADHTTTFEMKDVAGNVCVRISVSPDGAVAVIQPDADSFADFIELLGGPPRSWRESGALHAGYHHFRDTVTANAILFPERFDGQTGAGALQHVCIALRQNRRHDVYSSLLQDASQHAVQVAASHGKAVRS